MLSLASPSAATAAAEAAPPNARSSPARACSADRALQRCARRGPCGSAFRARGGQRRPAALHSPVRRKPAREQGDGAQDDVDMKSMTLWMQLWSMDD